MCCSGYEYWNDPTPLGFAYILMMIIGGAPIVLNPTAGFVGDCLLVTNDSWDII
ncbi:MAG: hypothetical protein ACYC3W_06195 [Candidatus Nanopelagicales bacterium]